MKKIRSIFVSDLHLGAKFSQTDLILNFMKWVDHQRPENFYIVGDFIDGWKIKKNWVWNKDCNLIIRKIFSMLKHDTKVFYSAGNHDEFLRDFFDDVEGVNFAGLKIADEFIHLKPNGEKLLIVHGDKFDAAIQYAMKYSRFLCFLGDLSYDFLIELNQIINFFRRKFKLPHWSLSQNVKHHFKNAVNYVNGFEKILSDYAKEKDCKGVVCGHIHTACIKPMNDIMYYNCGDWVESNTFIVEYEDGQIELLKHNQINYNKIQNTSS